MDISSNLNDAPVHEEVEFSADLTRRSLLKGGAAVGAVVMAGDVLLGGGRAYAAISASTETDPAGTTKGLGTGTAPEQVHLTFGADPTTQMTVSFATPTQASSPSVVAAPTDGGASVTGTLETRFYTDGDNGETVYSYHGTFTGLTPGTSYTYVVSDGAATPHTFTASFLTAPTGRTPYVFTSFGDLGTPAMDHLNTPAMDGTHPSYQWAESSDNAYWAAHDLDTVAPTSLFNVLNGDLCYANLNFSNQPEVWRDFGINNQISASKRPWMPCYGNHEIEFGSNTQNGGPGASGSNLWNGPGGYAGVFARYKVPDNGTGAPFGQLFYSFQVGPVLFISLSADDVIYQDGGANYVPAANDNAAVIGNKQGADSIPAGTTLYNREFTGGLVAGPDNTLVPGVDTSATSTGNGASYANKQTIWLTDQLKSARASGSTVDMIVVSIHQCAVSTSSNGNGSDLGIRQAWMPLFDQYSVDLVVNGHDHDYERTFALRGYLPGQLGTVVAPNPGQSTGAVFTRTPAVAPNSGPISATVGGTDYDQGFDTSLGTVFLTLGGGGTNGPTNAYGSSSGGPVAKVITQRNQVYPNAGGGHTKNGADSTEPAAWSAQRDTADAFGFAVFQVNPGAAPGQTTIVMQYFHAPVTGVKGTAAATSTTPAGNNNEGTNPGYTVFETVVFGRALAAIAPPAALPEFGTPALAAAAGLAVGGAALVAARRRATGQATAGSLAG